MVGQYIQPTTTTGLTASALNDFLQAFVVGLTAMASARVFPRWQAEPPNIPPDGTPWAAVGVVEKHSNNFPFVGKNLPTDVDYELQNHEELECLASFFDLGTDGQADTLAELFRDNMRVPQNLEQARVAGFAFVECSRPVNVPFLMKMRWNNRVDVKFVLRQQVTRVYPVPDIESLDMDIVTD